MNYRTPLPGKGLWAAAIVALALAAISPLPAETGPGDASDRYRVLVERNIFLRDRRPAQRGPSPRSTALVVRDSDRDVVLTGTGRRDDESVAFFENTTTGFTTRVRVGQAAGKGRIRSITLDGVEYERGGSVTRIDIGHALQGGRFVRETVAPSPPATTQPGEPSRSTTAPATAPAGSQAETRPAPSGSGAGSADIEDTLKQMRQRREQELRK